MTSRRERLPAGNTNLSARSDSGYPSIGSSLLLQATQTFSGTKNESRSPSKNDSMRDSLDSQASLQILQSIQNPGLVRSKSEQEANSLKGVLCGFSRPVASTEYPHRSVFLDPTVNNMPPSKTRSELVQKIKSRTLPHSSYDLDRDGYVSHEDFRLAKRFDLDGNGLLDDDEREIGKRVLADEFFRTHSHQLHLFGPNLDKNTHAQNVHNLASSPSFERAYEKLKSLERTLIAESSKPILDCMQLPQGSKNPLVRHNYFTNKFDATAWNDYDAIPRSASAFGLTDHGGSRHRLLFARQQTSKEAAHDRLEASNDRKPTVDTRRLKLITDVSIENS